MKKDISLTQLLIYSIIATLLTWFPGIFALILSIIAYFMNKSASEKKRQVANRLRPWIIGILLVSLLVMAVLFVILWKLILFDNLLGN